MKWGCGMRIAVCDDEKKIVETLCQSLVQLGYAVDGYTNPMLLDGKEYDLYFLDIDMKEQNGIELGYHLRQKDPCCIIIYLTNFEDYRAQAFGVHAFDYLTKPVDVMAIKRVMEDAEKVVKKQEPLLSWKTKDGLLQMKPTDIYYFEFYNRNVILHAKDGNFALSQNMHTIAAMMKPYYFVLPHKSFCINLYHVRLLKGYNITMVNGDTIPLSQKRSSDIRKELNTFLCIKISGTLYD